MQAEATLTEAVAVLVSSALAWEFKRIRAEREVREKRMAKVMKMALSMEEGSEMAEQVTELVVSKLVLC